MGARRPARCSNSRQHLLRSSPGTTVARRRFALAQADQLELLNRQLRDFDRAVGETFHRHPDAELLLSFLGIGTVLGAFVLAELEEDRARYLEPWVHRAEFDGGHVYALQFDPYDARRIEALALQIDPGTDIDIFGHDHLGAAMRACLSPRETPTPPSSLQPPDCAGAPPSPPGPISAPCP